MAYKVSVYEKVYPSTQRLLDESGPFRLSPASEYAHTHAIQLNYLQLSIKNWLVFAQT